MKLNSFTLELASILMIFGSFFEFSEVQAAGLDKPVIKIQTQVMESSGTPANYDNLSVRLQILTKNECLLRDEKHTGVSIKQGSLTLNLGEGVRYDASAAFRDIQESFDNSKTLQLNCYRGNPKSLSATVENFVPNGDETRILRMEVDIPNKNKQVIIYSLSYSPFAVNASNSAKLEGIGASGFLQVQGAKQLTQSHLEDFFSKIYLGSIGDSNNTPADILRDVLLGTSSLYTADQKI